ncbi:arylsulfatase B-like isoform X2 [Cimex lectularius]|uniref:Sulfatase N-terminal domain-containing protein n=1 Tax=Cimex lectularius TaxID=79782 RepID=A0A8I6TH11_CIMLE|nr:arylsulfatase B-like isoform X2 [Cimex lectularius]
MTSYFNFLLFLLLIFIVSAFKKPPNIVLIVADDLGWDDVSFHGSDQIPTPNIDALAFNGVILNQHYTLAMCSPSRAALLTGMQHYVIQESEPRGLSLNETLLPQMLSKAGYESHIIGKWHLGMHKKEYTPLNRGFKSHYGFWQGYHDYYSHFINEINPPYDGYDMRRNMDVDWDSYGKYSTDIFTEEAVKTINEHNKSNPLFLYIAHLAPHAGNKLTPCQAPLDLIDKFSYIEDPERQAYAAMMAKLDDSVGEVVSALKNNSMLANSVIIFISDNGAPTVGFLRNKGSNFPFRGLKATAWEGAHRSVAAIWSSLIKKNHKVSDQLMHVVDWLPTICSLAGVDITDLGTIDGIDMWKAISKGGKSPRKELLYNIDDVESAYAAYRSGDWKYLVGYHTRNFMFNDWYGNFTNSHDVKYNPVSVLNSKTGLAITKSAAKRNVKMFKKRRNKKKFGKKIKKLLLNVKIINRMRKEGMVRCNTEEYVSCDPSVKPCLFNLKDDPCERVNLAEANQDIVKELENSIKRYRSTMVNALNLGGDCRADPKFWNNTWTFWISELNENPKNISCKYLKI